MRLDWQEPSLLSGNLNFPPIAEISHLSQRCWMMSPIILEAIAYFVAAFGVSALVARSAPWKIAQYKFMALEISQRAYDPRLYDPDRISKQVKGRTLSKGWSLATLLGALFVGAFAFLAASSSGIAIYLLLAGGTIIFVFDCWQGVKLVNAGMLELGLKWPPDGVEWPEIGEARFDTRNPKDS